MADDRATVRHGNGAPYEDARWELPGYTHGRELGAGSAGRVVLAHHDATGTPVAIKYLNGPATDHRAFRAEAELLGRLRSPYVTQLYEYVEGPRGAAIVMELVDGIALRSLLQAEGATGPEAALTVLKGSLLGLAAAHAAGVVHRDYKPANVLVAADGSSKLVDFGIAVDRGDAADIAGTPAYMAPEQWAGRPASPAADVYAATATFFECLTGAKPYDGTTLMELAVQHTEFAIPDGQVPEALRPLIRSGLAKTPEQRPESAAALVAQLEVVAGAAYGDDWEEQGRRQLAALVALLALLLPSGGGPVAGTTSLATTVLATSTASTATPTAFRRRRAKWLSAATTVVLLGGALAGVAVAGNADSPGSTLPAGPTPGLTSTLGPATAGSSAPPSSAVPPGPSVVPPSASPPPSGAAAAPTTAAASAPPSGGPSAAPGVSVSPTSSTTPTAPPTAPVASPSASESSVPVTMSPTPTPTLNVIAISLGAATCYGRYGITVPVTVTTDGAADGTLTLTWIDRNGRVGTPQAEEIVAKLTKGRTSFSASFSHTFGAADAAPYWGVRATTDPAATRGQNAYTELAAMTCNPPR